MPAWMQNDGAWIAIGVSLCFIAAGFVMHRVFLRILKASPPPPPNETHTHE